MRIMHVTQFFMPWLGYQEYYLAREQQRAGHDVLVVTSNLRWPLGRYAALQTAGVARVMPVGSAVELGVPTARLRVRAEVKGRVLLAGLRDQIEAFRPDVVHAHLYLTAHTFELARRKRRPGFRLLVDEHQLPLAQGSLAHRAGRGTLSAAWKHLVLPRVDALVAVAEPCREWMVSEYGCPADRIAVLPLGADTDVFRPDPAARTALREELGIAPEDYAVLSTGKIAPQKRLDLLVRAVASPELRARAVLVLVGPPDPATLDELIALARSLSVRMLVKPPVDAPALARYFNAADVCVWPADATISHLEAAACGKPIVIPDEGGLHERIVHGNGRSVRTGDVAELAGVLLELLRDPAARAAMGDAGHRFIRDHCSWTRIAARFEALYRASAAGTALSAA